MRRNLHAWVVLLAVFVIEPAQAQTTSLRCDIATKLSCAPNVACRPVSIGMWNIIDMQKGKMSRCDTKGCDSYNAQISASGGYVNIGVPERGYMAKMSSTGSYFTEVATHADTVLLSFGSCRSH